MTAAGTGRSCLSADLKRALSDPDLAEDVALAFLQKRDFSSDAIELLARNGAVMNLRRVRLAVISHPRTPRHISVPALRQLYAFELIQVAMSPTVVADIKMAAEDAILARLETITTGERTLLARRASARVAAALLLDSDQRIVEAALDNTFLSEPWVVKSMLHADANPALTELVIAHPKWSLRRDVAVGLVQSRHTPLDKALEIANTLPGSTVREIAEDPLISPTLRSVLIQHLLERTASKISQSITELKSNTKRS